MMDIRRRRALYMAMMQTGGAVASEPDGILGANLIAWYDLSDISSLYQTTDTSTPVTANNDSIGRVSDKSSNGYHAIQATGINKPTYKTSTLNGLSVANFDGNDLVVASSVPITTYCIWVVERMSTTTSAIVFEHGSGTTNSMLHGATGAEGYIRSYSGGSQNRIVSTNEIDDDTWRVFRLENNNTGTGADTAKLYINAVNDTNSTNTTNAAYNLTADFAIGARVGAVAPMTGDIAEIVIASPYPSASQISDIDTYINNKWAVY